MSSSYREKKAKDPNFFLDEIPRELCPELFETSFDWDEEERILEEEEKKARQGKIRDFFRRR